MVAFFFFSLMLLLLALQERNYMWFLVLLGTAFVAIPIYQHYTLEVW